MSKFQKKIVDRRLAWFIFWLNIAFWLVEVVVKATPLVSLLSTRNKALLDPTLIINWPTIKTLIVCIILTGLLSYVIYSTTMVFFRRKKHHAYLVGLTVTLIVNFFVCNINAYIYEQSSFAWQYPGFIPHFIVAMCYYFSIIVLIVCLLITAIRLFYVFSIKRATVIVSVFFMVFIVSNAALNYFPAPNSDHTHSANNKRPNIVLYSICSWSQKLSEKTIPYIMSFSKKSISFSKMYSPIARSAPSEMITLSGKGPEKTGVVFNLGVYKEMPVLNDLITHELIKKGYSTWIISTGTQFRTFNKDVRLGFEHIYQPNSTNNNYTLSRAIDFPWVNLFVDLPWGEYLFPFNYGVREHYIHNFPSIFRGRLSKLSNRISRVKKPFFLYVNDSTMHHPYKYHKKIKGTPEDRYLVLSKEVDKNVSSFMADLKKNNLLKNTVVILMSDHGEEHASDKSLLQHSYYRRGLYLKRAAKSGADFIIGHGSNVNALGQYKVHFHINDYRKKKAFGEPREIPYGIETDSIRPLISYLGSEKHEKSGRNPIIKLLKGSKEEKKYIYFVEGMRNIIKKDTDIPESSKDRMARLTVIDGQPTLKRKEYNEILTEAPMAVMYKEHQLSYFPQRITERLTSPAIYIVLDIPSRSYSVYLKKEMDDFIASENKEDVRLYHVDINKVALNEMYHRLNAYRDRIIKNQISDQ